jgi:hypothetical protein
MGGRHQNFENPITWTQDISKTKFDVSPFFLDTLYYNGINIILPALEHALTTDFLSR